MGQDNQESLVGKSIADLDAAIEDEALAKAEASRASRRVELLLLARNIGTAAPEASKVHDLTKRDVAKAIGVSVATLDRAGVEPDYFVGESPRFSIAKVRAQLAARGKAPTKAATTKPKADDVDVSAIVTTAGLRSVGGGRR